MQGFEVSSRVHDRESYFRKDLDYHHNNSHFKKTLQLRICDSVGVMVRARAFNDNWIGTCLWPRLGCFLSVYSASYEARCKAKSKVW